MKTRVFRYLLLAIMTVLTAASMLLFPRININEDMSRYLPDESRMKEGVDSLKRYFPELDMNAYFVKVMFKDVEDKEKIGRELTAFDGVADIMAISEKDGYTMYQLSVKEGAAPKEIAAAMAGCYGSAAVVEHNANSIMPDNMTTILIVGVVIVFGILFLMCSSFVEALVFILTIGMAVILNMGTNAFLPSVSMMTNTIVAVLQLVLSMDYSIILMNRFRQVLAAEPDVDKAMQSALKSASSSILSSSLTTIVGLLALVFMKFKIGLDLGLVLAKGVLFSLISIYTILPALILLFYKGIRKTEKKVFLLPTDRLASFEYKARTPLVVFFVVAFVVFCYLSTRTELSYASIWESRINDVFTPKNSFSLMYKTSSEDKTVELTDSISSTPGVDMVVSYPSIFKKKLTVDEMHGNIRHLMFLLPNLHGTDIPDIPSYAMTPQTLNVLYYAASHPVRDERMSFEDMIQLSSEASKAGLLPEGMDVNAIVAKFTAPKEEEIPEQMTVVEDSVRAEIQPAASREEAAEKTPEESVASLADIARPTVDESSEDPYKLQGKYKFTKEDLNTPMNSLEIAGYLGFSKGQAAAAFSMAHKRKGTMTPDEFIDYMIDKVLGNKLLRKMISDKQAEGLHFIRKEMDEVLAVPDSAVLHVTVAEAVEVTPAEIVPEQHCAAAADTNVVPAPVIPAPVCEDTPMDRLAEMFASGGRYSSEQIFRALDDAGIDIVDKATLDLMFTYYGSRHNASDTVRMSLDGIIDFLSTKVATNEACSRFMDDSTRTLVGGLRVMVDDGMKMIRGKEWSMAAIVTDYPLESAETFDFVEKTLSSCSSALDEDDYYLIGESVMYKEMKDGFGHELIFLTLLTIVSIFLIVAFAFKSLLIPIILVMTVLTGVFSNVFISGIGGDTMLYLAYLIVQSILMGSTIDYGILYTNYYLGFRRKGHEKADAMKLAYRGSIHTIMTSGLIIVLAPFIMSRLLTDPTICSILSSLTFGALVSISLILLVLPAVLAACERKKWVKK